MEIVVLASALKRDTEDDIRHALGNPIATTDMDDSCFMVVGADPQAPDRELASGSVRT